MIVADMHALLLNLRTGLQLAMLRPTSTSRLRLSSGQFWLLLALATGSACAADWMLADPPREFNPFGAWEASLFLACLGLGTYLAARLAAAPNLQFQLPFCVLAALPFLLLAGTVLLRIAIALDAEPAQLQFMGWLFVAWCWLVLVHALDICARTGLPLRGLQATLILALIIGPELYYPQPGFWYTGWEEENVSDVDPAPPLDAEQVFFDQPGLLADRLRGMMPQRTGTPDLYILGIAGYGGQNVFRSEIEYLEEISETALHSGLRFLPLINHRDTLARVPLATLTNIEAATESLGRMMENEEDVLMVYVTSHGSEDHEIALELGNLPFNKLTPVTFSAALERARVRWKILVISACFSGGYIQQLAGPDTLVITAARADRYSFGCDNEAELTWFGRAFLEEGLALGLGFQDAFSHAEAQVHKWELEQEIEHSEPQIHMGSAIREKLREMELL